MVTCGCTGGARDALVHGALGALRDRVRVAEGREEGLLEALQRAPRGAVRLARRIIRPRRDEQGELAGPGLVALVGKRRLVRHATSLGRDRPRAPRLDDPSHRQHLRLLGERLPRQGDASETRSSPVGRPGVGRHDAREALRMLGGRGVAPRGRPSPGRRGSRPARIEGAEDARHPVHVPLVGVVLPLRRLVAPAESHQIRRDHAVPGRREHRDHLAVQERPRRLAVQQEHGRRVARPTSSTW